MARAAASAERHDDALRAIAELQARYPAGPFEPEALLLRSRVLTQARRLAQAQRLTEALIDDPRLRGKRTDLLRQLGEIWRLRDDCSQARSAWQRALELGLASEGASEVRAAMEACGAQ